MSAIDTEHQMEQYTEFEHPDYASYDSLLKMDEQHGTKDFPDGLVPSFFGNPLLGNQVPPFGLFHPLPNTSLDSSSQPQTSNNVSNPSGSSSSSSNPPFHHHHHSSMLGMPYSPFLPGHWGCPPPGLSVHNSASSNPIHNQIQNQIQNNPAAQAPHLGSNNNNNTAPQPSHLTNSNNNNINSNNNSNNNQPGPPTLAVNNPNNNPHLPNQSGPNYNLLINPYTQFATNPSQLPQMPTGPGLGPHFFYFGRSEPWLDIPTPATLAASVPSSANSTSTGSGGEDSESEDLDASRKLASASRSRKASVVNKKKRKLSTSSELDDDRKFKCDIDGCDKTFKRSGHLKRHRLVHLPATQRERFRCYKQGCNKHYSTKYDLAAHMRQVHDGVELLRCTVRACCRRFVRVESLEKHLKTFDHSGELSKTEEIDSLDYEEFQNYISAGCSSGYQHLLKQLPQAPPTKKIAGRDASGSPMEIPKSE